MPKTKPSATKESLAFGSRLVKLMADAGTPRRGAGTYLSERYKVSTVTANDWLNGRFRPQVEIARQIAADHGGTFDQLYFGDSPSTAKPTGWNVREASDADYVGEITFREARGSCGGGSVNWEFDERRPLIKEVSWFKRFRVNPDDTLAVWADGDSMSEFIVDGDIVIFDKSKQRPRSGAIFLIDHPDGLKIKRLRRTIDGSWILESSNPDKQRYPDEVIGQENAEMLQIIGEFIYRQGG